MRNFLLFVLLFSFCRLYAQDTAGIRPSTLGEVVVVSLHPEPGRNYFINLRYRL